MRILGIRVQNEIVSLPGYFVIFVVIPAAAILGSIVGAIASRMIGTKAA